MNQSRVSVEEYLKSFGSHENSVSGVDIGLSAPNAFTAQQVARTDSVARELGLSYAAADAGGKEAERDALAKNVKQLPVAEKWASTAPENVAFLAEDRQGLANTHDKLGELALVPGYDFDQYVNAGDQASDGSVAQAWKRGGLQMEIADLGNQLGARSGDDLRKELLAMRQKMEDAGAGGDDVTGFQGFVEQLPRLLQRDFPTMAKRAGQGVLVGGLVGSAVPMAGTIAGASAGATSGMIAGSFESAAKTERGSFIAEMLMEKDDAGNYLSDNDIALAGTLYGTMAGGVEAGFDAAMKVALGPVWTSFKETFGTASGKKMGKDAIKAAVLNKSVRNAMGAFFTGAAKSAGIEAMEEGTQQGLSRGVEAYLKNSADESGQNFFHMPVAGALSGEGVEEIADAAIQAAKTGAWFWALPGGVKMTMDVRNAKRAQAFAEANKTLADTVAASKTKQLSPVRMESFLQACGMDGEVLIPADAAWQMQQNGTDLASAMGWELADVEEAAALGHEISVPIARLQARLEPDVMKQVADVMRENTNAMSSTDASSLNEDLQSDIDDLVDGFEAYQEERGRIDSETERLRYEIEDSVKSSPHLMQQIETSSDPDTTLKQVVDDNLKLLLERANVLSRYDVPIHETLSRVSYQGVVKGANGEYLTPEEALEQEANLMREDAEVPFWETVWGRIERASLNAIGPNVAKDLAATFGPGIFSRKGKGVGIDQIVEQLRTSNAFTDEEGMGSDESVLVERLMSKKKPSARIRSYVNRMRNAVNGGKARVQGTLRQDVGDIAQGAESLKARGSITPDESGKYVIQLFEGANLSTLAHETSHFFFLEMERLEREGVASERMLSDLNTLRKWTSAMDDDAQMKEEYDRFHKARFGGREFESLDDAEKANVRGKAKQEMLARGFESYLREGRAPTSRLSGVFSRFGRWLARIYRDASRLGVTLTDEVRDVFDRMLAHEEEIESIAARGNMREETSRLLDSLGLRGAKRIEIEGLMTEAKEQAAESLRAARDANRRELRQTWRSEAEKQIKSEPVYQTRKALRDTPVDLQDLKDAVGDDKAKTLLKKLPGCAVKNGGVNAEVFAAELGYFSATDMADDVLSSPSPAMRVKQIIEEKQKAHDDTFDAEGFLYEQEKLALQQERIGKALDERIRNITAEARYKNELAGNTVGGEAVAPEQNDYEAFGRRARSVVGREMLKDLARNVLGRKTMSEAIQPESYRRAASKWIRMERKFILSQNWQRAMDANHKARVNIEMARQAADLRDIHDKLFKHTRAMLEQKKADPRARFAVFLLSQNMRLLNPTLKMVANAGDKTLDDINGFISDMAESGIFTKEDVDNELFSHGADWRGMSPEMFMRYADQIEIFIHGERSSRLIDTERGKVDFKEYTDGLASSILAENEHREPVSYAKRNELFQKLKAFHTAHLKADTIALLLDGDHDLGPVWSAVIRPINKATWNRSERLEKVRTTLSKLFSVYSRKELVEMKGKRFTLPGFSAPVTREQCLCILLNSGNASNLDRLMRGQNFTQAQVQSAIDALDERDVKFAQGVWDYFETFRKESFDLEERMTGVRPPAIKAQPVVTRFGTLRGGYYPIAYDPKQSSKAVDQETLGSKTGGLFPSVEHGSMKSRTATGLGAALKLSIDVIPNHLAKTCHMLAFREPASRVARVLNSASVNGAIQNTAGVDVSKALKDWLHYVAGERPATNALSGVLSGARKNVAMVTMGFKLTTMLAQTTGMLPTISEIGTKWAGVGLVKAYASEKGPLAGYQFAREMSPMMRNRLKSIDRDIFEMSSVLMDTGSANALLDPLARAKKWTETHAFLPMAYMQMFFCDLPTWHGAYAKAISEGRNVTEAAEYADTIVERTQVGGAGKDLAGIQRGGDAAKLFTMYYSYFSALYQLFARRTTMVIRNRDAASTMRLATLSLLCLFAEPVISATLTRNGPDDGEDWKTWAAKEAFWNPFNMIIGVRDMANALKLKTEGKMGGYRMSPVGDVAESMIRFAGTVSSYVGGKQDGKKVTLHGAKAAGLLTGLINAQEILILETFWNWLDGTSPDLELADLVRKKRK